MHAEQIHPEINGHQKTLSTPKRAITSKNDTATVSDEHFNMQHEHHNWLNKARKGQAKSRRLLALVSRLESMILDRDAKLMSLIARIEAHDSQTRWHDQVVNSDREDQKDHLDTVHNRYHTEHETVRRIFDHFEQDEQRFNAKIEDVVQALLRSL